MFFFEAKYSVSFSPFVAPTRHQPPLEVFEPDPIPPHQTLRFVAAWYVYILGVHLCCSVRRAFFLASAAACFLPMFSLRPVAAAAAAALI